MECKDGECLHSHILRSMTPEQNDRRNNITGGAQPMFMASLFTARVMFVRQILVQELMSVACKSRPTTEIEIHNFKQ
eukprot:3015683-Amphidinium_carterae.1